MVGLSWTTRGLHGTMLCMLCADPCPCVTWIKTGVCCYAPFWAVFGGHLLFQEPFTVFFLPLAWKQYILQHADCCCHMPRKNTVIDVVLRLVKRKHISISCFFFNIIRESQKMKTEPIWLFLPLNSNNNNNNNNNVGGRHYQQQQQPLGHRPCAKPYKRYVCIHIIYIYIYIDIYIYIYI